MFGFRRSFANVRYYGSIGQSIFCGRVPERYLDFPDYSPPMLEETGYLAESSQLLQRLESLRDHTLDHCINRRQFGNRLVDLLGVKERLCKSSSEIYALQSVINLLLDSQPSEHPELDGALARVLAERIGRSVLKNCKALLGIRGYQDQEGLVGDVETALSYSGTPIDVVKSYVALQGINFVGKEIGETVRLRRNPLLDPFSALKYWIKRYLDRRMSGWKRIKILDLAKFTNSTLLELADDVEDSVLNFHFVLEESLTLYGRNIQVEEWELNKIADYGSKVLSLVAVLSRMNFQLKQPFLVQSDHFRNGLATMYFKTCLLDLKENLKEIGQESYTFNDKNLKETADYILDCAKYPCSHPITKNLF